LPFGVGHDGAIGVWRSVHDFPESRTRILQHGDPDRFQQPAQSLIVTLAHEVMPLSVDSDHLGDLIVRRRRRADQYGHSEDTIWVPGGESELMWCGTTGTNDADGTEFESVQDGRHVVGWLTKSPPR
jgi:hypothetical protein